MEKQFSSSHATSPDTSLCKFVIQNDAMNFMYNYTIIPDHNYSVYSPVGSYWLHQVLVTPLYQTYLILLPAFSQGCG